MAKKSTHEELEQRVKELEDQIVASKLAVEALQESEEKYRILFENTGTATFVTEEDLTISKVNAKCEELSGYSREEIEGKLKTTDFISPEDLERLTKYHFGRREEVDESPPEYEFNLSDRHGNIRNVYIQVGVIPGTKQSIASIIDMTSHKQASEALRENERFLQSVFDGIQDGISVLDPELNIIRVNQWMDKIYSDQKPLVGKKCYEVYQQRKSICPWCPSAEAIKTGEPHSAIAPYPTKDSPKGWFDLSAFPILDAEDRVAGVIEHVKDITDRKRAERALMESEERYRNFIEHSPIAMFTIDTKGNFTYGNKKLLEMTGYKKEDWLNKPFHPIVHPEDLEFVLNKIQNRMAGKGTVDPYEIRIFDSSEKIMWVKINSESIYETDESGDKKLVGIQSFVEDITKRKRAEEALQTSHERFLTVLDSIDATVYVADMETYEILFMNKNMIEGFGRDMTGEICWDVFRGESKPCRHCTNDQLIDENGKSTGVHVWQGKNPITGKWYINYDRAIEWTDRRMVRLQIATDITNLKRMEEELRQAHKMESIGTLAGGIAHDFNNILGIILGNTELAMFDIPEWHPARLNLEEIRTASSRAKDVVRQLLSFARKTKLEKKPTNINPIIEESLKLLRSSIPTSIEIRQNIAKDVDAILADPTQINQVLINICTNAEHSMPDGGIMEVALKNIELDEEIAAKYPELNPGRYVNLVIKDTGHGIAQKVVGRIFDPYFTTKEVGKGTGMGLAVAHGIVKGHNGIILVESELGKGTTFSIYFPVVEKEAVAVTETDEKLPTGDERILFVDDEESIVILVHQILERLGYKVESTTSPVDALELFRSKPDQFDLVITDMAMPKMTGDTLVKEIHKIKPDIPIILSTGFSERIDEKKAKEIGIAGYIEKPVDSHDYAMKIRKVLDME